MAIYSLCISILSMLRNLLSGHLESFYMYFKGGGSASVEQLQDLL